MQHVDYLEQCVRYIMPSEPLALLLPEPCAPLPVPRPLWITVVISENFQHFQVVSSNKKRLRTLAFGFCHRFCWTCILVVRRTACVDLAKSEMECVIIEHSHQSKTPEWFLDREHKG